MALTTIKTYNLTSGVRDFQVTFEYLSRSFVQVALLSTTGGRKGLTVGTDYVWTSATNIQTVAALDTTGYDLIEIRRVTPTTTRIITFQDGSILRAGDLNKSELQTMHIAEEARDVASSSVQLNTDNNYDTLNRRIVNVADGIDPTDAINLKQLTDATQTAQGWVATAQAAAQAALVSQGAAKQSENAADGYKNQADASKQNAATSEANAIAAEQKAALDAAAAQQSNGLANQANTDAQAAKTAANASKQAAATAESNAKDWEAKAAADAARAKAEADRAKQEADKIAGQNVMTNAITGVGAAPGYVVDFKTMPTVNGVDITSAGATGGFQVNSILKAETATDDLDDVKYAGNTFMANKAAKNTPAAMEYDHAACVDVYSTWTPTGGTSGKTRVQTIYDKNAIWVRGYHHETSTWTPWKRANNQFYTDVTGMDVETIVENGSYYYFPTGTTNVPVIDSPEDSSVYFLEVNSSDDAKQVVQTVLSPKTNSSFSRYRVNNTWSRWWNNTATLDVDTAESGFDYNTQTNPGYWGVNNATALHAPTEVGTEKSILQVFGTADGTTIQTVFCPAKGLQIFRMKTTSGAWGAWNKPIVTTSNSTRINVTGIDGLAGGPLTLGGDAVTDSDAVTLRQLKAASGQTGATMNGVATDFIGAVQWFQGSRAALPAGYVAADGQLLKRSDYPELWNAINNHILTSVPDSQWLNGPGSGLPKGQLRGKYSTGSITTGVAANFRIPDLNGGSDDSERALFLRGDAQGQSVLNIGTVGEVLGSAAPEIAGSISLAANLGYIGAYHLPNGSFTGVQEGNVQNTLPSSALTGQALTDRFPRVDFAASKSNNKYGRKDANGILANNEIRPNSVVGIWIIRAAGSFHSADSNFHIISGDATAPAVGSASHGGVLVSDYKVAGVDTYKATMYSDSLFGQKAGATLSAEDAQNSAHRGTVTVDNEGRLRTASATKADSVSTGNVVTFMRDAIANPDIPRLDTCFFYAGDNSAAPSIGKPFNYYLGMNLAEGSMNGGTVGNSAQMVFPVGVDTGPKIRYRTQNPQQFTEWRTFVTQHKNSTVNLTSYAGGWDEATQSGGFRGVINLSDVRGNDNGYVSAISWGSASNGGYPVRATWGTIGQGTTSWAAPTLRLRGDGTWYTNFYFRMGGDITGDYSTDGSGGANVGFTYTKNPGSDERMKHSIQDYDGQQSLDNINEMKLKTFIYNHDTKNRVRRGVIAQQVEKIDPEYVKTLSNSDGTETKTLDSNVLLMDALAAIQVLSKEVKELKAQLAAK